MGTIAALNRTFTTEAQGGAAQEGGIGRFGGVDTAVKLILGKNDAQDSCITWLNISEQRVTRATQTRLQPIVSSTTNHHEMHHMAQHQ